LKKYTNTMAPRWNRSKAKERLMGLFANDVFPLEDGALEFEQFEEDFFPLYKDLFPDMSDKELFVRVRDCRMEFVGEWRKSKAKALLLQDLQDGVVHLNVNVMPAAIVYQQRPEFRHFPLEQFGNRLKDLRLALKTKKDRSAMELAALHHDRLIYPTQAFNSLGKPRWEGSEAQSLLKEDMDNSMHETMRPKALWNTREEYKKFELEVFRKHIDQETRRRKYINYLKDKADGTLE